MITVTKASLPDIAARVMVLREQLRDSIRTLSSARRAEVWEIVNEIVELEKFAQSAQ